MFKISAHVKYALRIFLSKGSLKSKLFLEKQRKVALGIRRKTGKAPFNKHESAIRPFYQGKILEDIFDEVLHLHKTFVTTAP